MTTPTAVHEAKPATHETDFLSFEVYPMPAMSLEELELQIRAIKLPHVQWADSFVHQQNEPTKGISHLRCTCLLKDPADNTLGRVEEAIGNLTHGNHKAVSSVEFLGYTKSF